MVETYGIGIVGLLIIGAILWRYVLAALRISTGIAFLAMLVYFTLHAQVALLEWNRLSGFVSGAVAGFLIVGVICARGIYWALVKRDELLEIDKARQRAKARM